MEAIKPTVTSDQASRTEWDVAVVGAGPAGATAARAVAMSGCRVLLVDKSSFPRDKVCGGCINHAALAMLHEHGLGSLPLELGAQSTNQLLLAADGRQASLALPEGAAVSRRAFDAALVRAALTAGVAFLPQTNARILQCAAGCPELHLDGHTIRPAAVLVADGLGATSLARCEQFHTRLGWRSRIGAGASMDAAQSRAYPPGIIHMACGPGGYVGVVRVENCNLNLAAALVPQFVRHHRGLALAAQRTLESAGLPVPVGLPEARWRGTPMLTVRRRPVAVGRVFLVGDAARYVEPFTGEGMAWAMASGLAVAPLAVEAARRWRPELTQRWIYLHHKLLGTRSLRCMLITRCLRHHGLTLALISTLAHAPWLARPIVRDISRQFVLGV